MGNGFCYEFENKNNNKYYLSKCTEPNNYILFNKIYDKRYGKILLYQDNETGNIIYKKILKFDNIENYDKFVKHKLPKIQLKHNNYSTYINYNSYYKIKYLIYTYYIDIFYYYPEYTLFDKILEYQNCSLKFNNDDIILFTYDMLHALRFIEDSKIKYNDFTMNMITVKYNNILKIDNYILTNSFKHDIYDLLRNKINNKKILLCSPYMFKCVTNKVKNIDLITIDKNNIFVLGLIILKITLQRDFLPIYSYKDQLLEFNKEALYTMVHIFFKKYEHNNKLICILLSEFLVLKDSKRKTASEIVAKLPTCDNLVNKLMDN